MPRETVHTNDDQPFQVKVGWERDCDVQIGVAHKAGELVGESGASQLLHQLFNAEQVGKAVQQMITNDWRDETPTEVGYQMLSAVGATNPLMSSVWVDLSRHEINKLITLLRRARDSAYGADA